MIIAEPTPFSARPCNLYDSFGVKYTLKKHRLKNAVLGLAGELFESSADIMPAGWGVSVTDGLEAYVTGCRAILSYGCDKITVDAGEVMITVTGDGLDIARYTDGEIVVRGRVDGITVGELC